MPGQYARYPVASGGGSGITSINGDTTSAQLIVGGTGITVGTSSGTTTITNTLVSGNQSANTVFAGPASGPAAPPTFRPLVFADLPALPYALDSFTIIQTPLGTSPTASSATDTLTLASGNANFTITGNSGTKTVTYNILSGNLTDVGTDGITITGGTGAVLGSGTSISQHVADSTHNGYLSSTDWSTFNGKQAAGNYITALTGDVTATGPGSVAATLATVNASPGTFTAATITVNAKGLVTSASSAPGTVTVVTKSANYTLLTTDSLTYFLINTSGGAVTLTLPTPASGLLYRIKDSTGSFSTNNLTVARAGAEQIDGIAASKIFQTNWGGWTIFSNGTNWFII